MIASTRTRHVRLELLVKRVVIIVKVSFVGPTVIPTVSIFHRSPATISMLVQLAVELRRFQQVSAHRFF